MSDSWNIFGSKVTILPTLHYFQYLFLNEILVFIKKQDLVYYNFDDLYKPLYLIKCSFKKGSEL